MILSLRPSQLAISVMLMVMSFTVYTGGNALLQVEVKLGGLALLVVLR